MWQTVLSLPEVPAASQVSEAALRDSAAISQVRKIMRPATG
jgi:hypothetical protein